MSRPPPIEQLATICEEVRILVQRAGDQEDGLLALVAAADMHVRQAEEALAEALAGTHRSVDRLYSLLSTQLRRSQDGADSARQLCAGAQEQRVAAGLLLSHLEVHFAPAPAIESSPRRDAVLVVDDLRRRS